jgi:hypothetical protein
MTPSFCRTPMNEDFPSSSWEYSPENGAIRIYETIFLKNLNTEIFIVALGQAINIYPIK